MSVPVFMRERRNVLTVARYMELDLPESRVNEYGYLLDGFNVQVVDSPDFVLYIPVARKDGGYYWCVSYGTATGGSSGGPFADRRQRSKSKLGALRAGIAKAMQNWCITEHAGTITKMEAALKDLNKYEYRQLTLF